MQKIKIKVSLGYKDSFIDCDENNFSLSLLTLNIHYCQIDYNFLKTSLLKLMCIGSSDLEFVCSSPKHGTCTLEFMSHQQSGIFHNFPVLTEEEDSRPTLVLSN